MNKKFVCLIILLIFLAPAVHASGESTGDSDPMPDNLPNSSDNVVLAEAYGFLIGADSSWGATEGYEISECVVNYSVYYMGAIRLDVRHLLKNVIWKSKRLKLNDKGQTVAQFSCDGTCLTQKAYTEDPSLHEFVPLFNNRTQKEITLLVQGSVERFNRALADVITECPGAQTKY